MQRWFDFSTNSCNAVHHIGIIDWGSVPRVLRCFWVFYKYIMTTTIFSYGSLYFVQEPVIFSKLFTLWFPRANGQNFIWRHLHIPSEEPLNRLGVSTNTTNTIPNDNTTSSVNNLASDSYLVSVVMDDIMNCVKSHIAFIKWHNYWFLCSTIPGDHMSICVI